MKFKKSLFFLLISVFSFLNFSFVNINENWKDKVSSVLIEMYNHEDNIDILVYFSVNNKTEIVTDNMSKVEKSKYVYNRLKSEGLNSQKEIVELLQRFGYKYKQFMIVNSIAVSNAKLNLVKLLGNRRDVEYISFDSPVKKEEAVEEKLAKSTSDAQLTWGIEMIKANKVWDLDIKGNGATVGGQDTGYDWTHPALIQKYRGYVTMDSSNHNYNWHDAIHEIDPLNRDSIIEPSNNPCGLNSVIPCDDHSHGTHTMGTMVGSNDSLSFGVAPDANWIGCRNMERGWGKPSTYIECFEWFMAPTDLDGLNPNPELSPDVINNSWGCPVSEGCDSSNWKFMETALNNLRNSGVFVVVSAGNDGIRRCGSINNPAAIFENSFTIGSTRLIYDSTGVKFNDTISGFSSRGPVTIDYSNRLKPDLTAPGSGVLSCVPNNRYKYSSGTSMAGPHIAGVVALMVSANPKLKGYTDEIERILIESADPKYDIDSCRGIKEEVLPNSTYGYGRVNALAAVKLALDSHVATDDIDNDKEFQIKFYPNPFVDKINIDTKKNPTDIKIEIFDYMGRIVFNKSINTNRSIDVEHLNSGMYVLKALVDGKIKSFKLIKL